MMRTSYMSTHEDEHLDFIIDTFKKVGKDLGLIQSEVICQWSFCFTNDY